MQRKNKKNFKRYKDKTKAPESIRMKVKEKASILF